MTKAARGVKADAKRDILKKIWSWILVGEEHRQAGMTMEFSIATTWLMRAGIAGIRGNSYHQVGSAGGIV